MTTAPDSPQQPDADASTVDAPGVDAPAVDGPAVDAPEVDDRAHDEVSVRRAPKISVFLIVGAMAGVVVSLIVTSLFPFDEGEGIASTYGYFALWGLTFGGAIGATVAIVADRSSIRRAKRVRAERESVDAPDEPAVEGELE